MKTEYKILIGSAVAVGILLASSKKTNMGKNTGGVNNPGNIRNSAVKFLGETSLPGDTFKSFQDIAHGIRAMYVLLKTYRTKYGLNTIEGVIARWAPPSDNNPTAAYIAYVAKEAGLTAKQVIPVASLPAVVKAMSKMEARRIVTLAEAKQTYDQFFA